MRSARWDRYLMISFSRCSSCFWRSMTDSMMARSSSVRCERSGMSAMVEGGGAPRTPHPRTAPRSHTLPSSTDAYAYAFAYAYAPAHFRCHFRCHRYGRSRCHQHWHCHGRLPPPPGRNAHHRFPAVTAGFPLLPAPVDVHHSLCPCDAIYSYTRSTHYTYIVQCSGCLAADVDVDVDVNVDVVCECEHTRAPGICVCVHPAANGGERAP